MSERKVVAVDLDDTLIEGSGGKFDLDTFGKPFDGAVEFTRQLAEFADILIFTCRTNPELGKGEGVNLLRCRVAAHLSQHGFAWHEIWTGVGKPLTHLFIDDRAIRCAPSLDLWGYAFDPSSRPLAAPSSEEWYELVLRIIRMELGGD